MKYMNAIASTAGDVAYYANKLNRLSQETKLAELDLSVVSSLEVSELSVVFYLDTDSDREAQRAFIHQVARVYGAELKKEKSYREDSLRAYGEVDGKHITIYGYVPPSCKLVEEEVPASDYDLEQASKLLEKRTRTVKKVVCNEVA